MLNELGELWRPISGYEGRYDVSSCGRVRSLTRKIMTESGKYKTINGRILKPRLEGHTISKRYLFVSLYKDGKEKQRKIHHLVLENFVGGRPPKMEGCHKDGNSLNNHVANLKWGTREDNTRDKIKHGHSARGERSATSVLKEDQVRMIRILANAKGWTKKKIAEKYNIGETTVYDIINRKSWKFI